MAAIKAVQSFVKIHKIGHSSNPRWFLSTAFFVRLLIRIFIPNGQVTEGRPACARLKIQPAPQALQFPWDRFPHPRPHFPERAAGALSGNRCR